MVTPSLALESKNVLSVRVSHLKSFIGFKAYFQFVLTSMNPKLMTKLKAFLIKFKPS